MPSTKADLRPAPRWHLAEIAAVIGAGIYLLWPTLRAGEFLGRDLVFAPYAKLDLATLGLSGASPRAVPLDSVVALSTSVFGAQITGRVALIATVVLIATGVRRLLPQIHVPGRLAAITVALINPFVVERLALGQWALLAAYGAVGWVLSGTRDFLTSGRIGRGLLGLWIASLTPTGGVLAVLAVVLVVVASNARPVRRAIAIGCAVLAQAPWIVAGLVSGADLVPDAAGTTVFAAQPHSLPVVLSLLTGGGIWNIEVVPPSQRGPLAWGWVAFVLLVAVVGARGVPRQLGPLARPLVAFAAVGFALALLPTTPLGADLVQWLSTHVPGAGLLRDSHKWVAPYVVLIVALAGSATERVCRSLDRVGLIFAAIAAIASPYALLPDAARVLSPTLRPIAYSAEWASVRAWIGRDDTTLVLPAGAYRNFEWNGDRPSIDPAPRLVPGTVLMDDTLIVGDVSVTGENHRARAAITALNAPNAQHALADLGIDFVLIERQTPGESALRIGEVVHRGPQLILVRVSHASGQQPSGGEIAAVVGAHVLYLLLPAVAVVGSRRTTRRTVKNSE